MYILIFIFCLPNTCTSSALEFSSAHTCETAKTAIERKHNNKLVHKVTATCFKK